MSFLVAFQHNFQVLAPKFQIDRSLIESRRAYPSSKNNEDRVIKFMFQDCPRGTPPLKPN
jgi:hypothetical protein